MCGIAGFGFISSAASRDQARRWGVEMAGAIAHRGPDDEGMWTNDSMGLALVHRRLSIIDVSPQGRQPMTSASGRFTCAFNGEVYNFKELRTELESTGNAPNWRGHSDTEVMLAACDAWGVAATLRRINGMFAVAIADVQERQLVLARDRLGEKPLYYGWQGNVFLFASELKALMKHPAFERSIDSTAVSLYMRYGYVPAPLSIFSGIKKLQPGRLLRVAFSAPGRARETGASEAYWTLPRAAPDTALREGDAVDCLDGLLQDAIDLRLNSDVPVGAFLSGGVDSSLIVAMMQARSNRPVHTFSIGFPEKAYDEATHASAVAEALGTQHTGLYVSADEALKIVPELPEIYDEPFGDSSQIPSCILARLARRHVTVALSGDAGDELFGGYYRYVLGSRLLSMDSQLPYFARRGVALVLRALAAPLGSAGGPLLPTGSAALLNRDRLVKLSDVLRLRGTMAMYRRMIFQSAEHALKSPPKSGMDPLEEAPPAKGFGSPVDWMMYMDQQVYLPDDLLVKVDRATMSCSLEARVPFLDHRIVEFAARLPLRLKIRGGTGKWMLRAILRKYLDERYFHRPKQGFAVPIASWLRGPLRSWAEELLSESALSMSELLEVEVIRKMWHRFVLGGAAHHGLWAILMFQAWYGRFFRQPA